MKKKFKILDATSGEKLKLGEGQMIVMNDQGLFFIVGNFMDYDTYVRKLSDVCPKFDVVWVGEALEDYVVRCDCGNTYVHNTDNLECSECEK